MIAPLLLAAMLARPAAGRRPTPARAEFTIATPGYRWQFPRDDGAHAGFANEWWYFTGNLAGADGRRFGFELTFFRISPAPGAPLNGDLYIAHLAVSAAPGEYRSRERVLRGAWGQAGAADDADAAAGHFHIWTENWQAAFDATGPRHLEAAWDGFGVALDLTPGSLGRVLNGVAGWSQKADGDAHASYYYSNPDLHASGRLWLDGHEVPVGGQVWMDHEFGSNQLTARQQGWDWMGLQLEGDDLMLFNLRDVDGARDAHSAGTWAAAGAGARSLAAGDFSLAPVRWWRSPASGTRYPLAWRVRVPGQQLDLQIAPLIDDQEFRSDALATDYWEGAVVVTGTRAGHPVRGRGYLELTGYGRRFNLLEAGAQR